MFIMPLFQCNEGGYQFSPSPGIILLCKLKDGQDDDEGEIGGLMELNGKTMKI